MIQSTSREAYEFVQPHLGEKQIVVLNALQRSKRPVCNQELADFLDLPINQVTPRVNELVKLGKAEMAFKEVYPKTGRKVIYWKPADNNGHEHKWEIEEEVIQADNPTYKGPRMVLKKKGCVTCGESSTLDMVREV